MGPENKLSHEDVAGLLQETSRTFALAVPLLPESTQFAVGLAYLLFRVADTLEDAATWRTDERKSALLDLAGILERNDLTAARPAAEDWVARDVSTNAGYTRLMKLFPELLATIDSLKPASAASLRHHARRTALGMRDMVDAETKGLPHVQALRDYCYIVAGIVGELLTELFVQAAPGLASIEATLHEEERAFGEGLQLVNILKDERDDAAEGRSFLPPGVPRGDVLALAAEDLKGARRYIAALTAGGAPPGFLAFTSLPCELAEKTLDALRTQGAGAKVPRPEVIAMFARYTAMANT